MKFCNNSKILYYLDFQEEFVKCRNQNLTIPRDYKWKHTNFIYKIVSSILYIIGCIISFFYVRFLLRIKVVNKSCLKNQKSGFFLYGNHTQPICDVLAPTQHIFPKRAYIVANKSNLGIPVIGRILAMLGGIVVPESISGMKSFLEVIEYRISQGKCIVIYPEAHVWPYCNFIRPFPSTSFRYPVMLNVPAYCMTTTYQKPRFGKKPKIMIYLDGPFLIDKHLNKKQAEKNLYKEIKECMTNRLCNSNYEYVRYERKT